MITPEKIEEWIKEIEQRSSSAPLILRYIANRLSDLSERNEELLSENITLRTGERVEEYERRISTLEYQLDLLKRQFGGESTRSASQTDIEQLTIAAVSSTLSLLVYDSLGRVLRLETDLADLISGEVITQLNLESGFDANEDVLRLLPVPDTEELLFLFTSGRIEIMSLMDLPSFNFPATGGITLDWQKDSLTATVHAGEVLGCLAPISKMALNEYFVQISRRGYLKKISTAMADTILSNRYIGSGVKQPPDQTFNLLLCRDEDRLTLVSLEGYVLCVEVNALPFSMEDGMRLGLTDHLVSAFISPKESATLVMTNIGKVIHRTDEFLEGASGFKQRGKGIYSQKRREEGVRVVGGGAVSEKDWSFALHRNGKITAHNLQDLLGSGAIATDEKLLAFSIYTEPRT